MKHLLILFVSLTVFLLGPQATLAHVLKSSGSIGGVMHVTPDDDPIAKTPTDFFIEFKDKQSKFEAQNCDCKVQILQSGKQVYSGPLFQYGTEPSLTSASFTFTFPEKDIYTIKISGSPLSNNSFQPFTLEYDLRVSRESDQPTNLTVTKSNNLVDWIKNHVPHLVAISFVTGFFIFALLQKPKNNSTKR